MRHLFTTIMLLGLGITQVSAQHLPETSVVVIGEVEGFKDGETFTVLAGDGEGREGFIPNGYPDNGIVKNGKFTAICYNKQKSIGLFTIVFPRYSLGSDFVVTFYANPGDTVYVKGKNDYPCLWSVNSDATEQKEFELIQKGILSETLAYQKAIKDHQEYRMFRRNTSMSEEEWDRTGEILKQKAAKCDSLEEVVQLAKLEIMKTLPANDVWMQALSIIAHNDKFMSQTVKEKIRELYNLRMKDINRKPDGKRVTSMLYPYPKAEIGKPIVDGEMLDMQGYIHRLSDFKGKYVVIDFWSTHCGPCIEAIPEIKKFVKRNPDIVVISLCLSQFNSWRTHPSYQNLPWYNLNDGGGWMGLARSYMVEAVPTYILISPDGIYLKKWRGEKIFGEGGTLETYIQQLSQEAKK